MHELGICDALLKMVDKIAKDEQLDGISRITVEVGTLSGVVPKYLEDCWVAVTDGTPYMNSEFSVEVVEGTAKCFDCGQEFAAGINDKLVCPFCGGKKLVPVSGRDLTLKEILAE